MKLFDLAIAFKWEFDRELVYLIENIFQSNGLKTYVITLNNLDDAYNKIKNYEISFSALFDRASDEDSNFEELPKLLLKQGTYIINRYTPAANRAITKASMHEILLKKNLKAPLTYILTPYDRNPELDINQIDLEKPFVVKPSYYSGAGEAVNLFAYNLEDVQNTRMIYTDDHFLAQKKIYPKYFDGRRAWFRVYFFFGKIVPVWWNDITHIYTIMFPEEIEKYGLKNLYAITRELSKLARLDYFSTEITCSEDGEFYLIDYVNDQCDFRFKSLFYDGAPEGIIIQFIQQMLNKIISVQKNKPSSIVPNMLR